MNELENQVEKEFKEGAAIDLSKGINWNSEKKMLLTEILICQKEVISTPLRVEYVEVSDIKRIFEKYGIKYESPF